MFAEGHVVEVVGLDLQAGSDMLGDLVQPVQLFVGELGSELFLFGESGLE
jgi:hypothetical protein